MDEIIIKPIGTIFTPHTSIKGMPIQPLAAKGIRGFIKLLPEYTEGLKDLEGFSHITLLYHFHKIEGYEHHSWTLKSMGFLPVKHPKGQMQ